MKSKLMYINLLLFYQQFMDNLPKIGHDENIVISSQGLTYIQNNRDKNCPQRNYLWTTDFRVELPVRVKKSGVGSEKPYTVCQLWKETLQKFEEKSALNFEVSHGKWITWSYKKYYQENCTFARALIALGIPCYSTINIIGFNSPCWAIAFHGSIFGNYLPIGMYTTNGPQTCQYIANHSETSIVVLEDWSHLKKYIAVKGKVERIKYFIMWKGNIPDNLDNDFKGRVLTWQKFMEYGKKTNKAINKKDELEYRMSMAKPGNCCTFIYTSGTTGPPKAVMISHDNYTWTVDAIGHTRSFDDPQVNGNGRIISMLPLSHVAAQIVDLVLAIRFGFSLFFTDPSALQGNLIYFLKIARPTFFVCVPRVWQKMQQKISLIGLQTTGFKKTIANWARSKAAVGTYAQVTGKISQPLFWSVAKKLVFNKIKQNLGFDQCQQFVFSAAPMRESTRQFFLNINIFLQNCYGMSQLSGPQTLTDKAAWDTFKSKEFFKEAGRSLPGLELIIDNPDAEGNGQICLRGRNCFMGYFKDQDETRRTVDGKGFVHSGDVGMIGKNGSIAITGRIKQLLITAGGENVSPVLIQNVINTLLPIFSHVVVIGDRRKYLVCLMCLRLKDSQNLADEVVDYIKERGSNAKTIQEAIKDDKVKKIIDEGINNTNQKAISQAQRIVKYKILQHQFSIDGGQLTPTLKLKRKIINQLYKAEIQSLYIDSKL